VQAAPVAAAVAAPVAAAAVGVPVAAAVAAETVAQQSSCEIEWWRGWVRSQFVACSSNGSGEKSMIAESPSFSWRGSEPPPETPAAVAAYLELAQKLDSLGWEPDGRGDAWFDARFRLAQTEAHGAEAREAAPSGATASLNNA
jgi:hypothetical protein